MENDRQFDPMAQSLIESCTGCQANHDLIAELEAAYREATPGKWEAEVGRETDKYTWLRSGDVQIAGTAGRMKIADAKFCEAAHNKWPALLAVARKAREAERVWSSHAEDPAEWDAINALRAALAALESQNAD